MFATDAYKYVRAVQRTLETSTVVSGLTSVRAVHPSHGTLTVEGTDLAAVCAAVPEGPS